MEPHEAIVQAIADLRDEARAWRELQAQHTKSWYSREPFKGILTHATTVCMTIGIVYALRACTGAPVSIEVAERQHGVEMPTLGAAGSPPEAFAQTVVVIEPLEAGVPHVLVSKAPMPSLYAHQPTAPAAAPTAVDAR
jgi:hypothetical protein